MLLESARRLVERATGWGSLGQEEAGRSIRKRRPVVYDFADDGETPNNPVLPLLRYRCAIGLEGRHDPAAVLEEIFSAQHWRRSWRNGVYDFLHFHSHTHEVLGVARGWVKVRLGGAKGKLLTLNAGDVVVLPAGTGHCRVSKSRNLLVVGAYPPGGRYDEPRPEQTDLVRAREEIAKVPVPEADPVYGREGPLISIWCARLNSRRSRKN
ncbi:MAG TPA: hypothetical protein VFW28_20170 [Micropepsaceae bacterium]|nr:hypothetical protein [Micropepsaceae bacterium]